MLRRVAEKLAYFHLPETERERLRELHRLLKVKFKLHDMCPEIVARRHSRRPLSPLRLLTTPVPGPQSACGRAAAFHGSYMSQLAVGRAG